MTCYSNSVTARLEGRARRLGRKIGVVISKGNSAGRFFCANLDGRVLSRWIAMGWSSQEARDWVERQFS